MNYINIIKNFIYKVRQSLYFQSVRKIFGTVMLYNYVIYFFLLDMNTDDIQIKICIRVIAIILCLPLIYKPQIFKKNPKITDFYWYLTLTYCLPFFFTFMLLLNNFALVWIIDSISALFLVVLMVDLITVIIIYFIGVLLSLTLYKCLFSYSIYSVMKESNIYQTEILGSILAFAVIAFIIQIKREMINNIITNTNKNLQDMVNKKTMYLEDALNVRTNFLNNISHEIRTPIHSFYTISEGLLLNWDSFSDDERKKYIQNIFDSALRLKSLANNILEVSKMDYTEITLKYEIFDLNKVILELIDECKSLYSLNCIEFQCDETIKVNADLDRVAQVLRNLITNAIKFKTQNSKIIITASIKKNITKVSVSNAGIGVPKGEEESIFEAFVQSSLTSNKPGGSGLGLSICKKLIQQHNGEIWLEQDDANDRTVFSFTIPNHKNEQKVVTDIKRKQITPKKEKYTILAVDDEITCLISLDIIFLNSKNYNLLKANNGSEAIKILEEQQVDLVLLDLMMPGISGIDIVNYIRVKRNDKLLPIIIQSGAFDIKEVDSKLIDQISSFIHKPYTKSKIIKLVDQILVN